MSDRELRRFRAREASMVYQDPGTALNPTLKIGRQVDRGVHRPRPRPQRGAASRPSTALRRVRIADPDAGHAALPAPALGRHAAARRDRHGAGVRPEAARARRADHRARRHGRGRGARPRARAAPGDRRGDPAHRPQPRRDPLDVRPGRRDVRRQGRRGGRRRRGVRGAQAPVHDRAAAVPAPPRRAQDRAGAVHDPRHAAADRDAAADVRVRRPLRARRRDVPHRVVPPEVAASATGHFTPLPPRRPPRPDPRAAGRDERSTCSAGGS